MMSMIITRDRYGQRVLRTIMLFHEDLFTLFVFDLFLVRM